MKTTENLLEEVIELGFNKDEALESIDKALDVEIGLEKRNPIDKEQISDELYETILLSFQCEAEWK